MISRRPSTIWWAFLLLIVSTVSCKPKADLAPGHSLPLAAFTENSVEVSIRLTRTMEGYFLLEATFTPPPDSHLYGKDIPRAGVDGLGQESLPYLHLQRQVIRLAERGDVLAVQEA